MHTSNAIGDAILDRDNTDDRGRVSDAGDPRATDQRPRARRADGSEDGAR